MIPNQWYVILESNEVKPGRPVGVTRLGEKLVAWRDHQGKVAVVRDLCPHRGAALSAGRVVGDCVACPFHGFQFDPTGRCTLIPANGKNAPVPKAFQVQSYPVCEAHGFIYLWWGEPCESYPPVPFFDNLDDTFSYITYTDHWTVHYTRAIENQLDVMHLPYVHYNTIGRGGRTVVDGPICQWGRTVNGSEILHLWVYNRVDDGTPPRRSDEMPQPQRRSLIQFLMPNLWQNWLSDQFSVTLAFVPVDQENTRLYLRFYQNFIRTPILREIVNALSVPLNRMILRQDKRVVLTQRPKQGGLDIGQKLVPGDGPVIAYYRRRRELLAAAQAKTSG